MTPEREQEIRDRLKIGTLNAYESSLVFSTLDALRQEHERLKDSLEHMTGARDSNQEAADSAYALCAKIERLEAERDSLSRQVKIAVEALEVFVDDGYLREEAEKALSEIEKERAK